MSGPEDSGPAAVKRFLGLEVQRAVPAPGVDAHDAHAPVKEPARGGGADSRSAGHVVGLAVEGVPAGSDEDDVALGQLMSGAGESGAEVAWLDRVAVAAPVEVEHHARAEEPIER